MKLKINAEATLHLKINGDETANIDAISNGLHVFPPSHEQHFYDKNGDPNKFHVEIQTEAYIFGIMGNIHYAHQREMRDSAEYFRWVIKKMEELFVQNPEIEVRP
jgi:hypothetical protein